jgi:hypothetical protein
LTVPIAARSCPEDRGAGACGRFAQFAHRYAAGQFGVVADEPDPLHHVNEGPGGGPLLLCQRRGWRRLWPCPAFVLSDYVGCVACCGLMPARVVGPHDGGCGVQVTASPDRQAGAKPAPPS